MGFDGMGIINNDNAVLAFSFDLLVEMYIKCVGDFFFLHRTGNYSYKTGEFAGKRAEDTLLQAARLMCKKIRISSHYKYSWFHNLFSNGPSLKRKPDKKFSNWVES